MESLLTKIDNWLLYGASFFPADASETGPIITGDKATPRLSPANPSGDRLKRRNLFRSTREKCERTSRFGGAYRREPGFYLARPWPKEN